MSAASFDQMSCGVHIVISPADYRRGVTEPEDVKIGLCFGTPRMVGFSCGEGATLEGELRRCAEVVWIVHVALVGGPQLAVAFLTLWFCKLHRSWMYRNKEEGAGTNDN